MRIKKNTFLFLLIISINSFAQEKMQTDITNITKVTFLDIGISYEKKVAKFQSILGQAFMNTSISIGYSSSSGNTSSIKFDPALSLQYRYYYNYNRRQKKGKRTEMNSLNYLSPTFVTILTKKRISMSHYVENNRRPINTVGVVWGIQRNYNKRFSLDFNLGLGYLFTTASLPDNTGQTIKENIERFSTLGQLNLGFWLNRRK
jgi:hypothetical protein